MATELTVQSERAFQKQPHIFANGKSKAKSKRVGKGGRRWYKDVGLGFRTPKTAIEGSYIGMNELDDTSTWRMRDWVVKRSLESVVYKGMREMPRI
jgi:hypothetical protein